MKIDNNELLKKTGIFLHKSRLSESITLLHTGVSLISGENALGNRVAYYLSLSLGEVQCGRQHSVMYNGHHGNKSGTFNRPHLDRKVTRIDYLVAKSNVIISYSERFFGRECIHHIHH